MQLYNGMSGIAISVNAITVVSAMGPGPSQRPMSGLPLPPASRACFFAVRVIIWPTTHGTGFH